MSLGKGLKSLISHPKGGSEPHIIHREEKRENRNKSDFFDKERRLNRAFPETRAKIHQKQREQGSIFLIEVEKIHPNPYQPRKSFNEEALRELAESIKEFGIIHPIVVSKTIKNTDFGTSVGYQLIAGERRLIAAKKAGLERIPAIVRKMSTPKMKLELALIENIQRSDLNPIEASRAYAKLQDEFGLTQKEIAIKVRRSRESIANTMRLLNLPTYAQEALENGKINESQARMLLSISNPEERKRVFDGFSSGKMTTREVRKKIEIHKNPDPEKIYWQKKLEEKFGMPVDISKSGTRGKVSIQFYSDDEFQSIVNVLLKEELE